MDDLMTATRSPDSVTGTGRPAMPVKGDTTRRRRGMAPACLRLAAVPTAAHRARHFATRTLRRWQAPPEAIEAAEIIISELVTNAYQAVIADTARSGVPGTGTEGRICLRLSRMPGQVMIEVSDHSGDLPARSDTGTDADSGRGLMIVQALSQQWGYRRTPSGGKIVYAILSISRKHTEQEGQS